MWVIIDRSDMPDGTDSRTFSRRGATLSGQASERGSSFCRARVRRGVTVLEVLFATGIAITGLIGIASLLVVAGKQSSDATRVSEAQAVSQAWYGEFVTRGYSDSSRWLWFNDVSPAFTSFTGVGSVSRGTSVTTGSTASRIGGRHAVCIDPSFFSHPPTSTFLGSAYVATQAYRPGLFPYFQDNYNPLEDPNDTMQTFLGANRARLLRVSLSNPFNGIGLGRLTAKQIEQQFLSSDDLAMDLDDDDPSIPGTRIYTSGGSKALARGEYSWFATLSPRDFTSSEITRLEGAANLAEINAVLLNQEELYTLSIVICHRRDRAFIPNSAGAPPQGERLAAVSAASAFAGGAGGRITLSTTTAFDDSISAGDWVMLCRHQSLGAGTFSGTLVGTICRWYRVIGTDAEPIIDTASNTWTRDVILEGPDWVFGTNTQAVLVSNVVSVIERVIYVE